MTRLKDKIEVHKSKTWTKKKWWFRFVYANGEIGPVSQMYSSKDAAMSSATKFATQIGCSLFDCTS